MGEYKNFRVTVDLSAFFYDHRRVARVFIKKKLRSIEDLQNRISEIFKISEFYLTTGRHFLPASEDIRILSNDESVCVIPNNSEKTSGQSVTVTSSMVEKKHKKLKRPLESIPENSSETSSGNKKKNKKKKYLDGTTFLSMSEDEVPRKKKKSEIQNSLITDLTCSSKSNEKKGKQNVDSADSKHLHSSCEIIPSPNKDQNQSIVEREICNIESSQKINDIKKKLKQKADEYIKNHCKETSNFADASNIKSVLPKLQIHIKNCNDVGRSNVPDTVRLSRHVDTPIKTFSRYTPPSRITDKYLAKNKINIVKIDVVTNAGQNLIDQSDLSNNFAISDNTIASNEIQKSSNFSQKSDLESFSPPKNYVKEVISTFEKNISPDSKNHIDEQENNISEKSLEPKENGASNYTKAFLDQREPTTLEDLGSQNNKALNFSKDLIDAASPPTTLINGFENTQSLSPQLSKTGDASTIQPLKEDIETTNISLDISSIGQDHSYYLGGISQDSSFNSTNTSIKLNDSSVISKHNATSKRFGGVGTLLERLRESDSVLSQESDGSSQYVTKRKRIRKHRKKNKKIEEGQQATQVKEENYVVKPLNVIACPSIHIKFDDDNEMEVLEDNSINGVVNNQINSGSCTANKIEEPKYGDKLQPTVENNSVLVETVILSDENDDPIMENKSIFGEESISKAPLMTNKLEPKVGDVIAFKVLRMTENYNPQVSNYIVGKLEIHLVDKNTVYFKILRGEEELLPPSGKLSLEENTDVQNTKYKTFLWTDLIAPKLLYP